MRGFGKEAVTTAVFERRNWKNTGAIMTFPVLQTQNLTVELNPGASTSERVSATPDISGLGAVEGSLTHSDHADFGTYFDLTVPNDKPGPMLSDALSIEEQPPERTAPNSQVVLIDEPIAQPPVQPKIAVSTTDRTYIAAGASYSPLETASRQPSKSTLRENPLPNAQGLGPTNQSSAQGRPPLPMESSMNRNVQRKIETSLTTTPPPGHQTSGEVLVPGKTIEAVSPRSEAIQSGAIQPKQVDTKAAKETSNSQINRNSNPAQPEQKSETSQPVGIVAKPFAALDVQKTHAAVGAGPNQISQSEGDLIPNPPSFAIVTAEPEKQSLPVGPPNSKKQVTPTGAPDKSISHHVPNGTKQQTTTPQVLSASVEKKPIQDPVPSIPIHDVPRPATAPSVSVAQFKLAQASQDVTVAPKVEFSEFHFHSDVPSVQRQASNSIDPALFLRSGSAQTSPLANDVIRQIATFAPSTASDGLIELSLDPVELGRVRMRISQNDGNVALIVMAERPETIELMRRNSEGLVGELADLGFDQIDLSFLSSHDDEPQRDDILNGQSKNPASTEPDLEILPPDQPSLHTLQSDRMDLRL